MNVITPVAKAVSKYALGPLSNSKVMNKFCNWYAKDPVKGLAYSTIASIVLKDGIGCGMYVYQSLNNEKIPEERRKFVSALDLSNGLLMILCQIGMFFGMRKLNNSLFGKMFNKSFGRGKELEKLVAPAVREAQKANGETPSFKYLISQTIDAIKKDKFATFSSLSELAASTILAKRIVVPLIATPIANKVKQYMDKKDAQKNGQASQDKSDIPMTGKLDVVAKDDNTTVKTHAVYDSTSVNSNTTTSSTNLLAKYKK